MNNFIELVFSKKAIKDIFGLSNTEQVKKLFECILITAENEVDHLSISSVTENVNLIRIERVLKTSKTMTYTVNTNKRIFTRVVYIGEVFAKGK